MDYIFYVIDGSILDVFDAENNFVVSLEFSNRDVDRCVWRLMS